MGKIFKLTKQNKEMKVTKNFKFTYLLLISLIQIPTYLLDCQYTIVPKE